MTRYKNIAEKMMRPIGPMRLIRRIGHIRLMGHIGLIGLMSLMGLIGVACSNEDDLEPSQEEAQEVRASMPVEVRSYVSMFDENEPVSRAWLTPSGFSTYDDAEKPIGVSFTKDGQDPVSTSGSFFKSGDQWRTDVELTAGTYFLYGYAPHSAGIGYSITDLDGTNANYSTGAIITLSNVPTIIAGDLCVVVGAKNGVDDYDALADYSVAGLRRGDFSYAAAAITQPGGENPAGGTGNFVYLLFDHLYAAMDIHMRVHGDYHDLRTIKLKEMKVQASGDVTPTKEKATIAVTLTANDGSTSPITNITYTPTGDKVSNTDVFTSKYGEELNTGYQSFKSHFMPQGITRLILTCKYDVYDKKGNLVRQDCVAQNVLRLRALFDGFTEVFTGTRYNVYLTIKPTYLYVLSDPDLDNPTMVVEVGGGS